MSPTPLASASLNLPMARTEHKLRAKFSSAHARATVACMWPVAFADSRQSLGIHPTPECDSRQCRLVQVGVVHLCPCLSRKRNLGAVARLTIEGDYPKAINQALTANGKGRIGCTREEQTAETVACATPRPGPTVNTAAARRAETPRGVPNHRSSGATGSRVATHTTKS